MAPGGGETSLMTCQHAPEGRHSTFLRLACVQPSIHKKAPRPSRHFAKGRERIGFDAASPSLNGSIVDFSGASPSLQLTYALLCSIDL